MSAVLAVPVVPTLQPDPGRADRGTTVSAAPAAQAAAPAATQPATAPTTATATVAATAAVAAPTTGAAAPSRISRVIGFVRRLIGFGTMLADTVREHPTEARGQLIASWFDTPDFRLILLRLTRGLMRAAALEAWLTQRAARGHELRTTPVRKSSRGKADAAAPDGGSGRDAKLPAEAQGPEENDLYWLPTREQVEAEVRRRPIGAMIADICEDLGVLYTAMDRPTWKEMAECIVRYGGNLARLLTRNSQRIFRVSGPDTEPCAVPPPRTLGPAPGWALACARPP